MPTGLVYDCALLQKHVVKRFVCWGGCGYNGTFLFNQSPFTHSSSLKIGLEISWHGVAASRRLVTSPFSHYYNKQKCTEKGTLHLRYHQS